jgi:hypothetical protein
MSPGLAARSTACEQVTQRGDPPNRKGGGPVTEQEDCDPGSSLYRTQAIQQTGHLNEPNVAWATVLTSANVSPMPLALEVG